MYDTDTDKKSSHEDGTSGGQRCRDEANPNFPEERLLELVTADARESSRIEGVVIGEVMGLDSRGVPRVDFAVNPADKPLPARTTVPLIEEHIGWEVALQFERGDPQKPIVMGIMWSPGQMPSERSDSHAAGDENIKVYADGERLTLTADREITLRCGESSITLTRAGKILIRGKYLSSRSSGVNRIKGGSVQIN
jgi:hypothetical protein